MSANATMIPTNADTDAGASLGKALVAAVLYYTPVTILSLSQLDLPRVAMMGIYLLPFVVAPLIGLWRAAAHHTVTRHEFALTR